MKVTARATTAALFVAAVLLAGFWAGPSDAGRTAPQGPRIPATLAGPQPRSVPTDSGTEFHRISPCRIVDTRGTEGALANGTTRSYYVGGTYGFDAQGGRTNGCGIPTSARAVAANVSAVFPDGAGYLRAWPSAEAAPDATTLNYRDGASITTGTTLSLTVTSGKALTVRNYQGTTHLVIDVTGYYTDPMHATIDGNGVITNGSYNVLSSNRTSTGNYDVTFRQNIANCTVTATPRTYTYFLSVGQQTGGTVHIYTYRLNDDGTATMTNSLFSVAVDC